MRGHYGQEVLTALDKLHRMQVYFAEQFRMDMTRDEAKANLDARIVVGRLQNMFLVENGLPPVTMEEIRERQAKVARA